MPCRLRIKSGEKIRVHVSASQTGEITALFPDYEPIGDLEERIDRQRDAGIHVVFRATDIHEAGFDNEIDPSQIVEE